VHRTRPGTVQHIVHHAALKQGYSPIFGGNFSEFFWLFSKCRKKFLEFFPDQKSRKYVISPKNFSRFFSGGILFTALPY